MSTSILSPLILDLSSQQLCHVTNYSKVRGLKQELFTIFYASRGHLGDSVDLSWAHLYIQLVVLLVLGSCMSGILAGTTRLDLLCSPHLTFEQASLGILPWKRQKGKREQRSRPGFLRPRLWNSHNNFTAFHWSVPSHKDSQGLRGE